MLCFSSSATPSNLHHVHLHIPSFPCFILLLQRGKHKHTHKEQLHTSFIATPAVLASSFFFCWCANRSFTFPVRATCSLSRRQSVFGSLSLYFFLLLSSALYPHHHELFAYVRQRRCQ